MDDLFIELRALACCVCACCSAVESRLPAADAPDESVMEPVLDEACVDNSTAPLRAPEPLETAAAPPEPAELSPATIIRLPAVPDAAPDETPMRPPDPPCDAPEVMLTAPDAADAE